MKNNTVYFIMAYLQGQTLKSYIRNRRITEGQAVKIMLDISNALSAAHSKNILHRDISPDNIMICDDGTVKLLDFGAARQIIANQSQSLSVILKQGFAPLEQYQKKGHQGPWTDIYALGATIYNALTGDTSHKGSSDSLLTIPILIIPVPQINNAFIPQSFF